MFYYIKGKVTHTEQNLVVLEAGGVGYALHTSYYSASLSLIHIYHAAAIQVPSRFAATKLLEGDELMMTTLRLSENEKELIQHTVDEMEQATGMDRNAALADMRYSFLDELCAGTVVRPHESKETQRSVQIDRLLTNKWLAIPIFLCIMLLVFWLTLDVYKRQVQTIIPCNINRWHTFTLWESE